MTAQLITILAPVFAAVGIGFLWTRLGRDYPTETVTNLIVIVGAPCLAFSTISGTQVPLAAFAEMAGAMALVIVVLALVGLGVVRLAGLSLRGFLPGLTHPNCGNMGLPLALFAFGETGLGLAIACFMVCSATQFTVGVGIAAGTFSIGRLARVPILYAVAAGILVLLTGAQVPVWLANTTELLGEMTIPLMLITLGVSLARLRVGGLGRSLALAAGRLVTGFLTGWAVAEVFGLEGMARGVLILQASMPVAVFAYLFAQYYDTEPEEVAGLVVASTTLSFMTLPLLLWFIL